MINRSILLLNKTILNSICLVLLGEAKATYVQKKMEISMERRMSRGVENQKSGKVFDFYEPAAATPTLALNFDGLGSAERDCSSRRARCHPLRSHSSALRLTSSQPNWNQPRVFAWLIFDFWPVQQMPCCCVSYCAHWAHPADDHSKHFIITEHLNHWPSCHISVSPAVWNHTGVISH